MAKTKDVTREASGEASPFIDLGKPFEAPKNVKPAKKQRDPGIARGEAPTELAGMVVNPVTGLPEYYHA
jgi:hypothetical protein